MKKIAETIKEVEKRFKFVKEALEEKNKVLENINDELNHTVKQLELTYGMEQKNDNLQKLRELTMRLKEI